MAEELAILKRKRGAIKHKLTNYETKVKEFQDIMNKNETPSDKLISELELRTDNIQTIFVEFDQVQLDIECACEDQSLNEQYAERDDFTNRFSASLAAAKTMLKQFAKADSCELGSDNSQHSASIAGVSNHGGEPLAGVSNHGGEPLAGIKLPTISLPTFNGNYNYWLEYKDTYESLIHNSSISSIQKFHYLRASLKGDALKVIQSLEFSADNYKIGWDLLCKRYDNSRLLVQNHIKSLFEAEPLVKETSLGLRNLVDSTYKHLRALNSLNQPTEHWDSLIIYMICTKLDKNSLKEWEKLRVSNELPCLSDMQEFLSNRADWLETLEVNHSSKSSKDSRDNQKSKQVSLVSSNVKCNYCKQNHTIYLCDDFKKLDIDSRIKNVSRLKLCENCLCTNHSSKQCKSRSCQKCHEKHNTLLHKEKPTTESQVSLSSFSEQNYVLLSTALVLAADIKGKEHEARILLDCGSKSNYISEKLFNKLKLNRENANLSIIGINMKTSNLNSKCTLSIKSIHNNFSIKISCFILPKITENLPIHKVNVNSWKIPDDLKLADPLFFEPGEIDILVGAGQFWTLLNNNRVKLAKHLPILQSTAFGWIVAGPLSKSSNDRSVCNFSAISNLDDRLKQFWELEECTTTANKLSNDDLECESHFLKHVTKTCDGQFMVRLPFKHSPSLLGDSKVTASKRFLHLEKKFSTDNDFYDQYAQFMKEYINLKHMTILQSDTEDKLQYFLPHHGIVRQERITTKLRVVYDASALSNSGWSLNNLLLSGPNIINDLFTILIRFRQHSYVVAADIEKMYRQILIHPEDRKFQKILWREHVKDNIEVFCLNTVTYGTVSAPFLSGRCIKQLAKENINNFPIAATIIDRDFYVDDLLTGFDTEIEAVTICNQISKILSNAHFNLRKWSSNSQSILDSLRLKDNINSVALGKGTMKMLGVFWTTDADCLTYKIHLSSNCKVSKRTILAEISSVFDPLGLVSPCVFLAKLIIQNLWALKMGWDEAIPSDLERQWLQFKNELSCLDTLLVPRQVICKGYSRVELHGFSDASQKGYGACIFVRSINDRGQIFVHLLCAKTRVAPIKTLTIPRLELCSALMLAKLMKRVTNSLTINLTCNYWSDSQIVLCWLKTSPNILQTFVGNRVGEIQTLTDINNWSYVNTKDNPADLASRGALPKTLANSHLWFNGPQWLSLHENDWPNQNHEILVTELPEVKKPSSALTCVQKEYLPFHKFSTLSKTKRVMAYCLRFYHNCRSSFEGRKVGPLTADELSESMTQLVRLEQNYSFSEEIGLLSSDSLLRKSKLLRLSPFLDKKGLLRVGGRLRNSKLEFEAKHPLLIDGRHHLSKLIFKHFHILLCHAPPQLLLSAVRQKYWPTRGIDVAKRTVRECIKCFKFKPYSSSPLMSDLPSRRVSITSPFDVTGIDYAGHFLIRDKKGKGSKLIKSYVCLFIFFSTKALHLELVTDLTCENFIAALRRFSARRGKPSHIYSDNATNFVCASKELESLRNFLVNSQDEIMGRTANEGISWHFIPPSSPHFGGLWEAGVKNVKYHLFRAIGETKLTYEEFVTVLNQIEAILNSRPLSPLSADPNDYQPLTQAHFLIGRSLTSISDPNLDEIPLNRLSRYQLLQQINQSFWKRWSREYLSQLQQRSKWKLPSSNLAIDMLVVIKQDNTPPCHWPLGRIVEVHPDAQGVVRVVTVKTQTGIFKRAVTKVCPLPVQDN